MALRKELGPRFANDQQRTFFDSEAPELLYSGAFGAGKSRILCEKAYALAKRYPGAPVGIFRKAASSLPATTKLTFMRDVLDPADVKSSNKTEGWIELHNGSRIWFLGLDPDPITHVPSKVGSLDLAFAFVDEAVEVTEGDWIMLLGRLRHPASPWHQIAGATNPADPDHWLKRRFSQEHPRRRFLHASTLENKLLPADYLERMADFDIGIFRSRYVEGHWVSIDGEIFKEEWFQRIGEPPIGTTRRFGVDLASSIKTWADYTAVVEVVEDADHNIFVLGAWRERLDSGHREWMLDGPPHLKNGRRIDLVNVEAVAFQSAFAKELLDTTNLPVQAVHPDKDKVSRAAALAIRYKGGKVFHLAGGPGIAELEQELLTFPSGSHDDMVDALVYAAAIGQSVSAGSFISIA